MSEQAVGALRGRIAVITGAGRGIGREHALLFAREGAKVVVNDIGTTVLDGGEEVSTADHVVQEIRAAGGEAVASKDDVADWDGAARLIQLSIDTFGDLDVLVNNAGMTRHGPFTEMTEQTWDLILSVNLKATFMTLRHAAAHWRRAYEAGRPVNAAVVNTTSRGGLFARSAHLFVGNPGMLNYGVAKAGVAALGEAAARELAPFGVRVNTISPSARTALSPAAVGARTPDSSDFDEWDAANISPMVAWLCTASCTLTGGTFWVKGGSIAKLNSWHVVDVIEQDRRWTVGEIDTWADRLGKPADDEVPSL